MSCSKQTGQIYYHVDNCGSFSRITAPIVSYFVYLQSSLSYTTSDACLEITFLNAL